MLSHGFHGTHLNADPAAPPLPARPPRAAVYIPRRTDQGHPVYAVLMDGTLGAPDHALETLDRDEALRLRDRINGGTR